MVRCVTVRCPGSVQISKSASGERRLVTILFADVTGLTALGETLDPDSNRAEMARNGVVPPVAGRPDLSTVRSRAAQDQQMPETARRDPIGGHVAAAARQTAPRTR